MRRNLFLLAVSYFCGVTVFFANTTIINIIAKDIARDGNLATNFATFPFGFLILFTAAVLAPAGVAMNKYGHRKVFMVAAMFGLVGSLVCIGGLLTKSVAALCLFTFGVTLQGCAYGVVNYYRHIAVVMGGADDGIKSWCVAVVITSGALAGIAGPGIPSISRAAFPNHSYIAVYITLASFYLCHIIILYFVKLTNLQTTKNHICSNPRSLWKVISRPKYIHACLSGAISNGLMMMIMGATPILLIDHISLIYLSVIVQLHAVSMFIPSFFTSKLIGKFNALTTTSAGYFIGAVGAALYLIDDGNIWHIYACRTVSLVFIGVGWNFTFVSSTTLLASCYNQNEKLKAQSFNDTCLFGLGGVLSLLCGTFLKAIGLFYMIIISVVIYLIMALANLLYIFKQSSQPVLETFSKSISNEIPLEKYNSEEDSASCRR